MYATCYNGINTMYQWFLTHKNIIKRTAVYAVMTAAVIIVVTFIVFFVLGYRFDTDNGRIEQYALLQFGTNPSGATIMVDGVDLGSKTPSKATIRAGQHQITMARDGYETWQKTVDLKPGTITWLNYALLVPKKLTVESVATYDSVYLSLASPDGREMLVQKRADTPSFDMADLSSDTVKSTKLTIPTDKYSDASTAGVSHVFKITKWDDGGRYVLVDHAYGDKAEWLVLDTQNAALTKNITRLLNISISSISFSGTSGNAFYVLNQNDIRKLDLSAGTVSKPLVSGVTSFGLYKSNIITYIGTDAAVAGGQVAGLYRDGDNAPHVLQKTAVQGANLHIATTRYYNADYIAISDGKKVDILSGSYPNTASDNATSMTMIASYDVKEDIQNLKFSPNGEYIIAQSGTYFASYDLEHQTLTSSNIEGTGTSTKLKWLDDNYVWSDRSGSLVISEFDGTNSHTINPVTVGTDATLTHNQKYLYSINKSGAGYQLQRVLMILS